MAKIHLIGGEKGGVGKSFFARVLLDYCRRESKKIDIELFDVDRTNPDVGLIYEPHKYQQILENNPENSNGKVQQVYFSDNFLESDLVDVIFEKALTQTMLVNLPAQVAPLLNKWIEKHDLLTLGGAKGITFVHWFLCTGGYESIQLFKDSVNKYKGQMPHVLVRNNGLCFSWEHLLEDVELAAAIRKYRIKVIDLPPLEYKERNLIDANKWTFTAALNEDSLGMIGQQRIKMFLDKAYEQIEKGEEIVPVPVSKTKKRNSSDSSKAKTAKNGTSSGKNGDSASKNGTSASKNGNSATKDGKDSANQPSPVEPIPTEKEDPSNIGF